MSLKIRPAREADHNFILATWLKSFRELGTSRPVPEASIYFKEHQRKIKDRLASDKCLVASTDDEDQICGFMCYSDDVIHYVFVKTVFRGYGVANALLDRVPGAKQFSHFTKFTPFFARRKLSYNPYQF